jgi:hypothetical protein
MLPVVIAEFPTQEAMDIFLTKSNAEELITFSWK